MSGHVRNISAQVSGVLSWWHSGEFMKGRIGLGTSAQEFIVKATGAWPSVLSQELSQTPVDVITLAPAIVDTNGQFLASRLVWCEILDLAPGVKFEDPAPSVVTYGYNGVAFIGYALKDPCSIRRRVENANHALALSMCGRGGTVEDVLSSPGSPTTKVVTLRAADALRFTLSVPGSSQIKMRRNRPWPRVTAEFTDATYDLADLESALKGIAA